MSGEKKLRMSGPTVPDLLQALEILLNVTMYKDHPLESQIAIDAIAKAKAEKENKSCPKCKAQLSHYDAIGDFCPNKKCDVADDLDSTKIFPTDSDVLHMQMHGRINRYISILQALHITISDLESVYDSLLANEVPILSIAHFARLRAANEVLKKYRDKQCDYITKHGYQQTICDRCMDVIGDEKVRDIQPFKKSQTIKGES